MKKLLVLLIISFLTSCASGEDGVSSTNLALSTEIQTIAIRPAFIKITGLGKTQQLTLDVFMKDGSVIEGISDEFIVPESNGEDPILVQWTTQNFGIASITSDGLVTSVSSGDTFIKAKLGLFEAQSHITVESENSLNPNIDTALPPQ